ncbi:MAG: S-layer homology domain-containing protein, partial [Clostridiales bacterium]|nr:S-layer homology domain-containing protein [Clostridiales bacterium]
MKSLNRTLSLVLVLVMVLGVFGIAGAAFNDQNEIENTEAVSTMVALNIINGKNGNVFDPAGNVTRAEMAKMICVAL